MPDKTSLAFIPACVAALRQRITDLESAIEVLNRLHADSEPEREPRATRNKPRAPWGSKSRGGKPVRAAADSDSTAVVATKPKTAKPTAKSATEKIYDALVEHGPLTKEALATFTGLGAQVIGVRVALSDQFKLVGDMVKLT